MTQVKIDRKFIFTVTAAFLLSVGCVYLWSKYRSVWVRYGMFNRACYEVYGGYSVLTMEDTAARDKCLSMVAKGFDDSGLLVRLALRGSDPG